MEDFAQVDNFVHVDNFVEKVAAERRKVLTEMADLIKDQAALLTATRAKHVVAVEYCHRVTEHCARLDKQLRTRTLLLNLVLLLLVFLGAVWMI